MEFQPNGIRCHIKSSVRLSPGGIWCAQFIMSSLWHMFPFSRHLDDVAGISNVIKKMRRPSPLSCNMRHHLVTLNTESHKMEMNKCVFNWKLKWVGVQAGTFNKTHMVIHVYYADGLLQECSISIANALEILQSCNKPSMSSPQNLTGVPAQMQRNKTRVISQRCTIMSSPNLSSLSLCDIL